MLEEKYCKRRNIVESDLIAHIPLHTHTHKHTHTDNLDIATWRGALRGMFDEGARVDVVKDIICNILVTIALRLIRRLCCCCPDCTVSMMMIMARRRKERKRRPRAEKGVIATLF